MSDSKPQSPRRPPAANSNLLDFTPAPRKVKRPDGWTPERQRRFIELLAETGSPQRAAIAMNKVLSGIEAVYREPGAASFRAAWDQALEIARTRERSDLVQKSDGPPVEPPHRRASSRDPAPEPKPEPEEEVDTALRMELIERLVAKWQRKVGQERESRLAGEIVAADFYLRQVTVLEVTFDLMIEGQGPAAWDMLKEARRGGRNMLEIADTYMARVLDQARRDHWAAMEEPDRPLLWPERYCIGDPSKVDVRTEPLEAEGKASRPAAGIDPDEWCQMDPAEQRRIYDAQHAADAAAQVEWEARAREAWEASEHSARAREAWEASEHSAASHREFEAPASGPDDELDDKGEDFADRAMREAIAAARKAHPEDFE